MALCCGVCRSVLAFYARRQESGVMWHVLKSATSLRLEWHLPLCQHHGHTKHPGKDTINVVLKSTHGQTHTHKHREHREHTQTSAWTHTKIPHTHKLKYSRKHTHTYYHYPLLGDVWKIFNLTNRTKCQMGVLLQPGVTPYRAHAHKRY